MPLEPVPLSIDLSSPIPKQIEAFVRDGQQRVSDFMDAMRDAPLPSFVPSDFATVYRALEAVVDQRLCAGDVFLEWGSGFGVIACLAAFLDFEAYGIEIHEQLIDKAIELASDYELPVEFACGTFIPPSAEVLADHADAVHFLLEGGRNAYEELDADPNDFSLIFAYPWPGGERPIASIFDHVASNGALLMTYHGVDEIRLHRRIAE